MGIGEALAQVRHQAGLTVAEVSQRTRIREALIRDIETNDYSACGGDFYARGHIRAIAKATGAAPEPLIREFDATRQIPQALTLADIFHDTPATPIMPGTAATTRGRHRPNKTQALAVAVLAALLLALGFAAYGLLPGLRHAATAAPRARGQPTAQHEPGPNQRAYAAVPAHPPVQRRARTPVSTAAGDRPRSHRSQVSQLVDQRPLRQPASGHLHPHGLRPPAGHTRADQPRQRFRRGGPGARRPGGPTAYRPHGPRGSRGATAARHTSSRPLSAHLPHLGVQPVPGREWFPGRVQDRRHSRRVVVASQPGSAAGSRTLSSWSTKCSQTVWPTSSASASASRSRFLRHRASDAPVFEKLNRLRTEVTA